MFGLLLAIIAALSQSIVAVSSRVLKQVNSSVIMFNYGLTQAQILSFILVGIYMSKNRIPFIYESWHVYRDILIANIISVAGNFLLLIAYQNANPAFVGIVMYLGIGYNLLADLVLFNAGFSFMQILGISIALFFTIVVAISKMQQDSTEEIENDDSFSRIETSFKGE